MPSVRSFDMDLIYLLMSLFGGLDLTLAFKVVSGERCQVLALTGSAEVHRTWILTRGVLNERFQPYHTQSAAFE